jgi:hypothetical protein
VSQISTDLDRPVQAINAIKRAAETLGEKSIDDVDDDAGVQSEPKRLKAREESITVSPVEEPPPFATPDQVLFFILE